MLSRVYFGPNLKSNSQHGIFSSHPIYTPMFYVTAVFHQFHVINYEGGHAVDAHRSPIVNLVSRRSPFLLVLLQEKKSLDLRPSHMSRSRSLHPKAHADEQRDERAQNDLINHNLRNATYGER